MRKSWTLIAGPVALLAAALVVPAVVRAQDAVEVPAPTAPAEGGGGRGGRFDPAEMFDRMDTDKDGKLTKDELNAGFQGMRNMRMGGGRGGFDPAQIFDRMDENKDGSLDSTEFRGGEERFKEADKNGDGKVSKEEMTESFNARRGNGDGPGGPGGPGGGQIERIKESLGAAEEEWAVLKPRIEKVISTQGEIRGGGRGNNATQLPEASALREALDKGDTPKEDLVKRIDELRKAREKKQADLKAAREAVRELVTPRQEATLVLDGILD